MSAIRRKFAKNLKSLRLRKGLTQEELAEKLDISARYIQQLEGKDTPNVGLETLQRLAKALRVAPADLLK